MKNLVLQVLMVCCTAFMINCGHTHEYSPEMKKVVELNTKLWKDLNETKARVKTKIASTANITSVLDSLKKVEISQELTMLTEQRKALAELDQIIPALKGHEPKCSHEPGEPHQHNTVDVSGVSEKDLLELHTELAQRLSAIQEKVK